MKKALQIVLSFLAMFYVVGATASVVAAADDNSVIDLARPVYDAIRDGHYTMAVALGLVFLAAVLRRVGAKILPWFASDNGGVVVLLIGTFGTTLSAALAAGGAASWSLVSGAFHAALVASAGYSWLKRIVIDPLRPWMTAKAPTPIRWLYLAVAWMFSRITPADA